MLTHHQKPPKATRVRVSASVAFIKELIQECACYKIKSKEAARTL